MKTPGSAPAKRRSPAINLRTQIESALAAGHPAEALTLRLTLSDISHLKRDRTLAVSDISFQDGVMRFLGVKVEEDGVVASELVRP